MRWWWFGPAVTKPELERERETMKQGGIGGFEVQPVYPLSLDDPSRDFRNPPYLSPKFLDALRFVSQRARVTRRAMLMALPGSVLAAGAALERKKTSLPAQVGEFVRFADPTTENTVVRLTSPAYNNLLPPAANRPVSAREKLLIFSSDRNGRLAPCQAELRTGIIRQIADASALDPSSLTTESSGRLVYFLDGTELRQAELGSRRENKRVETLGKNVTAFALGSSRSDLFVIRNGRLEQMRGAATSVLAEDAAGPCLVRPGNRGCLFRRALPAAEQEFWYAGSPEGLKPRLLVRGRVSDPCWSEDGQSVLFLREVPKNNVSVSEIHEVTPETGAERCVTATSQFAVFAPNRDDSVFVGASKSKAQPNVVILLRSVGREMTLCEHRASHPASVAPVFSPDSRRVYFQSDHQGKPAIYSVNVELLVEPTQATG